MFGISEPRDTLQLRLSFQSRCVAVLNLRRLSMLAHNFRRSGKLKVPAWGREYEGWTEDLHFSSSLSDSILELPQKYQNNSWIHLRLSSEALLTYDEQSSESHFLPFLHYLPMVGGGLCSQACLFLATMLLYDECAAIFSLPEITYLAKGSPPDACDLNGLSITDILAYCRKSAGLTAHWQTGFRPFLEIPTEKDWKPILKAIRAYLGSRFPVLMPVDMDRMMGRGTRHLPVNENIYFANGENVRKESVPDSWPRDRRHMVLLVGCQRNGNAVLFQDCAFSPFMSATIGNIINANSYLLPVPNSTVSFLFGKKLRPATMVSITPTSVRLPLLQSYDEDRDTFVPGLMEISTSLEFTRTFNLPPEYYQPGESEYRLLGRQTLASGLEEMDATHPLRHYFMEIQRDFGGLLENGEMLWIELRPKIVLGWKAWKPPTDWDRRGPSTREFLLCYAFLANNSLTIQVVNE